MLRRPRAPIMVQPRHVYDLADELLGEILLFLLEPAPRARNGSSHVNGSGNAIEYGEASDLDRFRLVCKRFMRIGTPHKFSRFILRFSEHGFRRLEQLLEMQLACYVKTFTYMVRPFYQGSGWPRLLRKLATENNTLSQLHNYRLQEQTNLTETNYDKIQLQHAIAHFTSLQEIKLLRLQDDPDEHLIDFIHHHYYHHNHNPHHNHNQLQHNPQFTIHLDWSPACTRAITNLSTALLDSKCSSIRFTAPQINPESTRQLLRTPTTTLAALASRLTSLDINFHSNTDNITPTMADLSGVFKRFFMAAKNLVAIHIGFLNKTPLDLHLEDLFHSIRWKTLRKLSIQGWRLSAGEIIDLVRRHRCQLREFRLVGIYLRPGGRWCDVLDVLRGEMEQLERIDLRDIDYAAYSDLVAGAHAGVEVFDDYTLPIQIHGPASSSVAVAAGAEGVQEVEGEGTSTPVDLGLAGPDGLGPTEVVYGKNGIFGRVTVERVLALGVEDLGDDGVHVLHEQMPLWEAWVLAGSVRARRLGRVHGWSM